MAIKPDNTVSGQLNPVGDCFHDEAGQGRAVVDLGSIYAGVIHAGNGAGCLFKVLCYFTPVGIVQ